ncbi:MAG: RDD family protein [Proteobacteria bacterium]|nr:RDD family protein [Pseudomonadota bacterium]
MASDSVADSRVRSLVTPEGVDLRVRLATASERAGALLIDLALLVATLIGFTFLVIAAFSAARVNGGGEAIAIIWLLGAFLLRNFYFTAFECSARGATPGKRLMGIRVAARNGGALSADRIIARNAIRELELYLPIGFLFAGAQDVGAIVVLCGIVWCAIFMFFPLFNRDRLRLGDVVAGTWVLKTPKRTLLPDMAHHSENPSFRFTEAQLDKYGVKELHVLEAVLRDYDSESMRLVAERIRAKIDWRRPAREEDPAFLRAYYAALRRRLEQKLLFGVRKRDKHDNV